MKGHHFCSHVLENQDEEDEGSGSSQLGHPCSGIKRGTLILSEGWILAAAEFETANTPVVTVG